MRIRLLAPTITVSVSALIAFSACSSNESANNSGNGSPVGSVGGDTTSGTVTTTGSDGTTTTGTVTTTGAGTTTTGSRSLAQNGVATAIKVTSTKWIISGTGLT